MGNAHPAHWDEELRSLELLAQDFATQLKATAIMGVAVDDDRKRDYFVPRLQAMLDNNTWARRLVFRVVPVLGGTVIELRAAPPPIGESR